MFKLSSATLTCPHCGFKEKREMPETGYLKSTTCASCGKPIEVSKNDCCVFCIYSDMYCLRKQEIGSCSS